MKGDRCGGGGTSGRTGRTDNTGNTGEQEVESDNKTQEDVTTK